MSEHTKGLLRVGRPGAVVAEHPVPEMSGSDALDYYGGHMVAESVTPSNARRIVACWNACLGLPTDELEQKGLASAFSNQLLHAERQRDVLIELLREARNPLITAMEASSEDESTAIEELIDRIDSVLAGNLPERRITKPARVWGARFRPGIPEQTIIEAAYRYAEHESSPEEKEAGKINFDLLMAAVHKIAPEGWQLVPVVPTTEMVEAYFAGKMEAQSCTHQQRARERVTRDYRAMLAAAPKPECWCHTCRPVTSDDMRMVLCPDCGNKRCPRANDHRNACTGSNEPGQEGSAYPAAPKPQGGEPCALESPSSSPD